jgi:filamentous hemagglutinin
MRRLEYKAADYHTARGNTVKSAAPTNGQDALDFSMRIGENTPRRVAFDRASGEIVIFDQTSAGVYHGHVRTWDQLNQQMRNVLIESGDFTRRGVPVGQ